jgi:hypothetical protein
MGKKIEITKYEEKLFPAPGKTPKPDIEKPIKPLIPKTPKK